MLFDYISPKKLIGINEKKHIHFRNNNKKKVQQQDILHFVYHIKPEKNHQLLSFPLPPPKIFALNSEKYTNILKKGNENNNNKKKLWIQRNQKETMINT